MPVGTKMQNNTVAYEDGKIMPIFESAGTDGKKPKMKDLCSILAVQLQKHNKLRKV